MNTATSALGNTLTVQALQTQINQLPNSLLQATRYSGVSGTAFPKYSGVTFASMSSLPGRSGANVEMLDWEKPLRIAKGEALKRYMKNSPIWQS